jgi:hypothetical protein
MADRRAERFFLDWTHVRKGRLEMTLDPDRITERGRERIEYNRDQWDIIMDESGHGLEAQTIPYGVRIRPEPPERTGPWLSTDRSWERGLLGFLTVIDEGDRYRCWYEVQLTPTAAERICPERVAEQPERQGYRAMAYAESEDGHDWTKPEIGVFDVDGTSTNVVGSLNQSAVMRDPTAPEEERYRAFHWTSLSGDEGPSHGLYGATSPDGYHWSQSDEPLFRYFHDTQNVPAWDPERESYVAYLRDHHGGRAIGRSETDDFDDWPRHETVLSPGPEDGPSEDYYTNCYTTYPGNPSLRLLFPAVFRHLDDAMHVRLAVSRDNRNWHWVSRDPVFGPADQGDWDGGTIYPGPNLVRLPDGRLALPYGASQSTHTNYRAFYDEYPKERFQFGWAIWEDGRLAGIEADEIGSFVTGEESFDGGTLEINARTSPGGAVAAALHEPHGRGIRPIDGFGFDACQPFSGDAVWMSLSWRERDLSELAGRTVLIQFRLRRAKLFAYRIGDDPDGGRADVETVM